MFTTVLDAAEEVVVRKGIGRLTLDEVAKEANLSKGGLMHHFRSKDALIKAMVHRRVCEWKREYEEAIAAQPAGPGRVPRAFLGMCLANPAKWTGTLRRSGLVLVAALVHDQRHVEPLRQIHREIADLIADDGLAPGVGEAVMLAVDGLWFDWIFGITEIVPGKLAGVKAALERLSQQPGCGMMKAPSRSRRSGSKQTTSRAPVRRVRKERAS